MTIAYLANSFPEPSEPYVWEEISVLRSHGQRLLPCSIRRPKVSPNPEMSADTLYIFPLRLNLYLRTAWVCARRLPLLMEFFARVINGPEPLAKRVRAIAHSWLGVYLAVTLRARQVQHIHVHHGYFSAWAAMVAARILGCSYSLTLHGSDLLLRSDFLDMKLKHCRFCITISEFNRQYILKKFPEIDPGKIVVARLGIDPSYWNHQPAVVSNDAPLIVSVGRLHAVKNHAFLILACRLLQSSGMQFRCAIAGEGEERPELEQLIRALGLEQQVKLLGHISHEELPELYAQADVVVLTSRSEGIPLVMMEAMAAEKLVLAPEITGIPELIKDGKTGFLYQPNSMEHFLHKLQLIVHNRGSLDRIRHAARRHVECEFNGSLNLEKFGHIFLQQMATPKSPVLIAAERDANENPVLQQI